MVNDTYAYDDYCEDYNFFLGNMLRDPSMFDLGGQASMGRTY